MAATARLAYQRLMRIITSDRIRARDPRISQRRQAVSLVRLNARPYCSYCNGEGSRGMPSTFGACPICGTP